MSVNDRPCTNAACAPIDWLAVQAERERERERARESEREKRGSTREANLTCPKIEALYGRARIQMDADRRPRRRRVLSPLPLALDEISLHPVLQQHEIGCSQLLAWFLSL
jgi:hypothetical protein